MTGLPGMPEPAFEEQLQIVLPLGHLTVAKLRAYLARLDKRAVPDETTVHRSWDDQSGIITLFSPPSGLYVTVPPPPPAPGEAQA